MYPLLMPHEGLVFVSLWHYLLTAGWGVGKSSEKGEYLYPFAPHVKVTPSIHSLSRILTGYTLWVITSEEGYLVTALGLEVITAACPSLPFPLASTSARCG